jgi:heme-degrading monooxygenase HmoA
MCEGNVWTAVRDHRLEATAAWENVLTGSVVIRGLQQGKEFSMILRMWRGWTRTEDAEAYADYILGTGIEEYKATPGNRAAHIVSRLDGERTEFLTISLWDNLESIVGFAGEDIERAVFYPEDDEFLIDRETTVSHYVVHEQASGATA